jgi:hypothetical protein
MSDRAELSSFSLLDGHRYIMEFRKAHLEAFQKKYGLKLGFMSAFAKAAAYALQDQPVVNAVIDGQEIIYRDYVDISVAVATPKGLVVPVIRNVERMNFADVEMALSALGEKARKGNSCGWRSNDHVYICRVCLQEIWPSKIWTAAPSPSATEASSVRCWARRSSTHHSRRYLECTEFSRGP